MAAQMTKQWWKSAWPSKTRPSQWESMSSAIEEAREARGGLSASDYQDALTDVRSHIPDLQKAAKRQFKVNLVHKHTAFSNLADLEKLVESRLKSIKPNTTPVTVFKKPFGIHLRDKVKDADVLAKSDRIDIELKLMAAYSGHIRPVIPI